jgi:hypothetical protein
LEDPRQAESSAEVYGAGEGWAMAYQDEDEFDHKVAAWTAGQLCKALEACPTASR